MKQDKKSQARDMKKMRSAMRGLLGLHPAATDAEISQAVIDGNWKVSSQSRKLENGNYLVRIEIRKMKPTP